MKKLLRQMFALESITKRSTLIFVLIIFCIWLISLMVAIYSSEDVLNESSFLRAYVDAISWCWPFISHYSQKSNYQQVALLYNSIVWLALPFMVVLMWRYLKSRKVGLLVKNQLTFIEILLLIVACFFYSFLGLILLIYWNGTDVRLVNFASSREQLGVFGIAIPLGVAMFLTPVIAGIKKIFTGKF